MNRVFGLFTLFFLSFFSNMNAQNWYQMHIDYDEHEWLFPVNFQHVSFFDFNKDNTNINAHLIDADSIVVPFFLEKQNNWTAVSNGITLSDELQEWGKNKYKVFAIYITTDDGADIQSKEEYKHCYISVDAMGEYPDNSLPGQIRGRGNSTWEWYPKKPYRIKFDVSSKMFGIKKNKDWVLLANYRDVTKMMNVYTNITAQWMGIPFTTPVRFAELFINGEYRGVYQVAEQVEVGGNRVAINEEEGLLLTLDVDDGPHYSPNDNNFYTKVYDMPMQVKNPKNLSGEELDEVRDEFAVLENAIKAHNYKLVDSLMDIDSYIRMIQLQEFVYNVELSAPRSVFLFRDKGGKFTFGPAWDWDAGFDFNWSDMYTGHTFFTDYRETLLGTRPYDRNGNYQCPKFFTDMFGSGMFVKRYKELWNQVADSIYIRNWNETQPYIDALHELQAKQTTGYTTPITRETDRWPLKGFDFDTEIKKMMRWLRNRLNYLNPIIEAYPEPDDDDIIIIPDDYTVAGTIEKAYTLQFSRGYSQYVSVEVDPEEIADLIGDDAENLSKKTLELLPLNSDGTVGNNTAAKEYGAWFDQNGDTNQWANGHVYIESDELFNMACGCHPNNFRGGDVHTVTMQYRHHPTAKAVNLKVTFTIEGGWSWP